MEATTDKKVFIEDSQIAWQQVDKSVQRKIMGWDNNIMMVKVAFETGGIGTVHDHPHVQITHIQSGRFEVEIAGKKKILSAGDAFYIPPHVRHGVVCLDAGVLVDVFNPMREDFV